MAKFKRPEFFQPAPTRATKEANGKMRTWWPPVGSYMRGIEIVCTNLDHPQVNCNNRPSDTGDKEIL